MPLYIHLSKHRHFEKAVVNYILQSVYPVYFYFSREYKKLIKMTISKINDKSEFHFTTLL